MLKSNRNIFILAGIIYTVLILIMPEYSHEYDSYCWGLWSEKIYKEGIASAYTAGSPVNYLPLYLYVLRIYAWLSGPEHFFAFSWTLKSVSLLFDIASLILLIKLIPDHRIKLKHSLLILLNPAFWYNSLIWNQVDGILSFFVFASFYSAIRNRTVPSVLFLLLGLNFKLQAIVFLPVLLLLWLQGIHFKTVIKAILSAFIVQIAILFPFLKAGTAGNIPDVVFGSVNYYPSISMNAFNLWHLVFKDDLFFAPDYVPLVGNITVKQAGMLLFFSASGLVLLPLLLRLIRTHKIYHSKTLDIKFLLLSALMTASFFFYFNTQMHERYIHPTILFSSALALYYKQWLQWGLLSLAYFLSLESVCRFFPHPVEINFLFQSGTIAILYTMVIAVQLFTWIKMKPFSRLRKAN